METDWVKQEITDVDFGDVRLNKRLEHLLGGLGASPPGSIPSALKGWSEVKAAYRFFSNARVTAEEILRVHKKASIERIRGEETVLLVQDTSEIDYTGHASKKDMGLLNSSNRKGFLLHPLLAVTPQRLNLGVVGCQEVFREELIGRNSSSYRSKPIEEKESYRWIKGHRAANAIAKQAPNTRVVNVCDREGDIYELFAELSAEENKAEWLIRAAQNRNLSLKKDGKREKLFSYVQRTPVRGHVSFELPKRGNRPKREVRQEVRAVEVELDPPRGKKSYNPLKIGVVHCCEINCPVEEERIEWFLLTSMNLETKEMVFNIIDWYICRWQIEIFFRVLKSGCKIEKLQLEKAERLLPCLAVYMIIAWRIMYVAMLGRSCPDIACNIVFDDDEWQSVYMVVNKKPPPKEPLPLGEFIIMIAKLGGYLNRKGDSPPGPKHMWIGMQRARDFTIAWQVFSKTHGLE